MSSLRTFFVFLLILRVCISEETPLCHEHLAMKVNSGTLHLNGSIAVGKYLFPKDITFKNGTDTFACVCKMKPCLRTCCRNGHKLNRINGTSKCVPMNEKISIVLPVYNGLIPQNISSKDSLLKFSMQINCDSVELDPTKEDKFYLQTTGQLYVPYRIDGANTMVEPEEYCIAYDENEKIIALQCMQESADITSTLYKWGMTISIPFLAATFMVYAYLPELHNNVHGKCLMSYTGTLLTAYVMLVSVNFGKKIISDTYCVTAPIIAYFSWSASFFWLNVMCTDIWWTFSGRRGIRGSDKGADSKRLWYYNAYAWGSSGFMTIVCIVLQFAVSKDNDFWVRPEFGEGKCWFPGVKTLWYYFYGPITVLLLVNLILFCWTTRMVWKVKRETDRSMQQDSKRHGEDCQQRYILYLKLMMAFGINWVLELISANVNIFDKRIWWFPDMVNACYGVIIFAIFVCKSSTWKLLKKRYKHCKFIISRSSSADTKSSELSTVHQKNNIELNVINKH